LFSGSIEKRQKPMRRQRSAPSRETRTVISVQNLGFGKVRHCPLRLLSVDYIGNFDGGVVLLGLKPGLDDQLASFSDTVSCPVKTVP